MKAIDQIEIITQIMNGNLRPQYKIELIAIFLTEVKLSGEL